MTITIRKLQKKDEKALIDICYVTGDLFLKKIFPDPYLFGLFWCLYYIWFETKNCFVAVDIEKDKVVGYIFSSLNTLKQEENFKQKIEPLIKNRIKELRMKSVRAHLIAYFIIHKLKSKRRQDFLQKYPAHLHIDILPDYQRQGIGSLLMKTLENHFKKQGIPGYHLEVGRKNRLGISFYKKLQLKLLQKTVFSCIFGRKLNRNSHMKL